jgi:hypothetical protein
MDISHFVKSAKREDWITFQTIRDQIHKKMHVNAKKQDVIWTLVHTVKITREMGWGEYAQLPSAPTNI